MTQLKQEQTQSGGQNGDTGMITGDDGLRGTVIDTSKPLGRLHAHQVSLTSGEIKVGDVVQLKIDTARRAEREHD